MIIKLRTFTNKQMFFLFVNIKSYDIILINVMDDENEDGCNGTR